MPFYKQGTSEIGNKPHGEDWIEYEVGSEPAELKALLDVEAQAQLIAHFKSLYLGVVQAKLDELDYDSLDRVAGYACRPTSMYYAESNRILDWHEAIIIKNYALLTAGVPMTDEEYLAEINGIVF